jgi:8-oxo-dGTP diphosphatase
MLTSSKMQKGAKIFIVNQQKELLLFLRDNKPTIPYPNFWDLLGGEVEPGEPPKETIKRELIEEIGQGVENLEFIAEKLIGETEHCKTHILYYFKAKKEILLSNIVLTEGQDIRWFNKKELDYIKIPPFHIQVLNAYKILD